MIAPCLKQGHLVMPGLSKLAASAFVLAIAFCPPAPLHASTTAQDDPAPILADQSVSIDYGSSLTFHILVSAAVPLTEARLTIQYSEQMQPYSEQVPVQAGTSIETSVVVSVLNLGLPPVARLAYYWDFTDSNGRAYRTVTQEALYQDTDVPWEWAELTNGQVVVHAVSPESATAQAALEIATSSMTSVSQMLGIQTDETIHLYVYPELAQLVSSLQLHGLNVDDWVAAYAIPDQRVAFVAASANADGIASLRRDVPHEIAHLLIHLAAPDREAHVPGWFNEGVALVSSPEPEPALANSLYAALEDGEALPSLESLCVAGFGSLPAHEAALAYAKSELAVRYILDRYGASHVGLLMGAYADGLSCEGAVQQVLGLSLTELDDLLLRELSESAPPPVEQNISLTPWLIVWVISLILVTLFIAPQPDGLSRHGSRDGDSSGYEYQGDVS
jgi:hypothetical protein